MITIDLWNNHIKVFMNEDDIPFIIKLFIKIKSKFIISHNQFYGTNQIYVDIKIIW